VAVASMTGFARAGGRLSERLEARVLVRSVNHRYLDVVVRHDLPVELPEVEAAVREEVERVVRRGRVVVQLRLVAAAHPGPVPEVDGETVVRLARAAVSVSLPAGVDRSLRLGELLALPGVVRLPEPELQLHGDEIAALRSVLREALAELGAMRRREAEALVAQVEEELAAVEGFAAWVRPRVEELVARQVERLRTRLEALLEGVAEVDEGRLVQEAGTLAERADIAEEVVRLGAHVAEARRRLAHGGEVGRALDFLCQEMLRELNTIGSKARDAEVVARLVDAKGAVERLREQVQNLE